MDAESIRSELDRPGAPMACRSPNYRLCMEIQASSDGSPGFAEFRECFLRGLRAFSTTGRPSWKEDAHHVHR
jgi:hypothetical protein